jgi:hypothetical protein
VTDDRPTLIRHHDSPNESITGNTGPVATGGNAELHDRTGLYLAIIAFAFSVMAFGMAIVLPMVYSERMESLRDRVQIAERNSALAREDIRVMQQALAARGIQTDPHAQEKK